MAECLFAVAGRNWAESGVGDGTRLVTLGGVRVWEIGILREGGGVVVVVVDGGHVSHLGWSFAVAAGGEDVAVGSGDGSDSLFGAAVFWVRGRFSHWTGVHFHDSRLIQAVHVALHLLQKSLLLSLGDASETHSWGRHKNAGTDQINAMR